MVDDVRRIAVLRANALGDFVFTLPALEALRAAYPDAEIVLLARRWHADFLHGRAAPVDRVIPIPPVPGLTTPPSAPNDAGACDDFLGAMTQERFDIALQLHGGGRYSNPFVRRLGARVSAGLCAPDAAPLDRWCAYVYYQHEVMRYLEAVALVGARPVALEPRLHVSESDRALSRAVVPNDDAPLVLIHPGAGDPRRRWAPAHFARVGDALARRGAHVIVNGVGDNRELACIVVAAMHECATPLDGPLSLPAFAGLLSRCRLAVSNDSGPLHLARAVGTASVGIYWCGNLVNAGPLTTHRHRPVMSWRLHCPECGVNYSTGHCDHEHSLVADAPVADVTEAAIALLTQATDNDRHEHRFA